MRVGARLLAWCVVGGLPLAAANADAQLSGTITGTVVDNVGVIPGATVTVTEASTGATRSAVTSEAGVFRFPALTAPGRFSLQIDMPGFTPVNMADIALQAGEIRDLGRVTMAAGTQVEAVQVTAQVTPVQVASSSRGSTVDSDTLANVQVRGRDAFALLRILPGVADLNTSRDFTTWRSATNVSVNGAPATHRNVMIDGIAMQDEGGDGTAFVNPNVDAIGEMQIITNGFTAENGRNTGGSINVVTKSGTSQFRASGWYNARRQAWNANDYFRIKNNIAKPVYKVDISGYSIGGPVVIPRLIDSRTDERKLFFFFSQEFTDDLRPSEPVTSNLPTAAERIGDFSDTRRSTSNANGTIQPIIDPLTGQPFPGNIIPQNRIHPVGQAMLNLLPMPTGYVNPVPADRWKSNSAFDFAPLHDRKNHVLRLDAVLTRNTRGSFKYLKDSDDTISYNAVSPGVGAVNNTVPGLAVSGSLTQVFGASMVNELNVGYAHNKWGFILGTENPLDNAAPYEAMYRQNVGLDPPRLLPFSNYGPPHIGNNQFDEWPYLPNMLFAGGDRDGLGYYRPSGNNGPVPRINLNYRYSLQNDLTITKGRHNFKFGVYTEFAVKADPDDRSKIYTGEYNFGHNANNPNNTTNGYANALLGYFNSYQEITDRLYWDRRHWQTEAYAQDSWRVSPRITIDYGMRFTHSGPIYEVNNMNSGFFPDRWDAGQAPRLYRPICLNGNQGNQSCPGSQARAFDPSTNTILPFSYVGSLVPGTGSVDNGILEGGIPGKREGWYYDLPGLVAAPRLGMAWDVTGDGKTAIRASTGIFYNYPRGQFTYLGGPTIDLLMTVRESSLDHISAISQSGNFLLSPGTAFQADPEVKLEKAYNFNLAFQRDIGFNTVAEVAYVGSWMRDGQQNKTVNNIPLYAYGNVNNLFNNAAINPDFLREPYPGMGNIQVVTSGREALNYNALQLSANRRLSGGLQFGGAYTLAKGEGMGHHLGTGDWDYYTETYFGAQALRDRYYGPTAVDRRHLMVLTYSYNIPTATQIAVLKQILSDWQVSGLTQFMSGGALDPVCNAQNPANIGESDPTLTGVAVRCELTGAPVGEFTPDTGLREEDQIHFNLGAFRRPRPVSPTVGNFGNAPIRTLRHPSWWNSDLSIARRVPIPIGRGTSARIQLQVYNVFNLVEFTTMNTTFTFNSAMVNTSANTGKYTAAAAPRQMALQIRFDY